MKKRKEKKPEAKERRVTRKKEDPAGTNGGGRRQLPRSLSASACVQCRLHTDPDTRIHGLVQAVWAAGLRTRTEACLCSQSPRDREKSRLAKRESLSLCGNFVIIHLLLLS